MRTVENKKRISKADKVKEIKALNKKTQSFRDFKYTFDSEEYICEKIFQARLAKTTGTCVCGRPYSSYKKVLKKPAYKCRCGKKLSLMKGTCLENTKVKLMRLVELFYFLFTDRKSIPTSQLVCLLQEKDYDSVYNVRMKVCELMGNCVNNLHFLPDLPIEIDECYPYFETGLGSNYNFKKGPQSERCAMVVNFVQRDGVYKSFVLPEKNAFYLRNLVTEYAPKNLQYYTDESKLYKFMKTEGYTKHDTVNHKLEFAKGDIHTNSVEGFNSVIKTALHRVHKGITFERMQSYLNSLAFKKTFRKLTPIDAFQNLLNSLPPFNVEPSSDARIIPLNQTDENREYIWKSA